MQDIKKKFWLEKFDCFSVTGKDARKFLNGITTSNILNSENKVIKTCWLSPNGVLRALIEIIVLERNLEVIILAGKTNEIIDYFNQIIFPADDVLLSEPFLINRIQEIDESSSWRTYLPIFFKTEDKEFEIYKNKLNLLNPNDLKILVILPIEISLAEFIYKFLSSASEFKSDSNDFQILISCFKEETFFIFDIVSCPK